MSTLLIVNADDFGASSDVNDAVLKALHAGVLTSTSLMVNSNASREAISFARDVPGLAIGLHITLSVTDPILPALKYYFHPRARRDMKQAVVEQFERFAATGLPLSHVDGHQHLHAHPSVLPTVIEQAIRYGAHGIRIPREPFLPAIRADRTHICYKIAVALGHAYLARVCKRHLAGTSLAHCEVTIGSLMSGQMNVSYVDQMLRSVNCRSIEIFFHPQVAESKHAEQPKSKHAEPQSKHAYGPNPGDLETLLSLQFREIVTSADYCLTNYAKLRAVSQEAAHERA